MIDWWWSVVHDDVVVLKIYKYNQISKYCWTVLREV